MWLLLHAYRYENKAMKTPNTMSAIISLKSRFFNNGGHDGFHFSWFTLTPLQYLSPNWVWDTSLKFLSTAVICVYSSMGRERAGVPDNRTALRALWGGEGTKQVSYWCSVVYVYVCTCSKLNKPYIIHAVHVLSMRACHPTQHISQEKTC